MPVGKCAACGVEFLGYTARVRRRFVCAHCEFQLTGQTRYVRMFQQPWERLPWQARLRLWFNLLRGPRDV